MTPRDFIYWLQGHFEIAGCCHTSMLSVKQLATIRRHLNMVPVAKFDTSRLLEPMTGDAFCSWLQGVFDAVDCNVQLPAEKTSMIKKKLDKLFVHAANPTPPKEPQWRAMC